MLETATQKKLFLLASIDSVFIRKAHESRSLSRGQDRRFNRWLEKELTQQKIAKLPSISLLSLEKLRVDTVHDFATKGYSRSFSHLIDTEIKLPRGNGISLRNPGQNSWIMLNQTIWIEMKHCFLQKHLKRISLAQKTHIHTQFF